MNPGNTAFWREAPGNADRSGDALLMAEKDDPVLGKRSFARVCAYFLAALFAVFLLASVREALKRRAVSPEVLCAALLFAVFAFAAAPRFRPALLGAPQWLPPVLTVSAAVAVRIVWLVFIKTLPVSDFERFYKTALMLASGKGVYLSKYVATFPHTLGYSAALSLVFRVFGASASAAQGFNVFLSAGIALLLYRIGKRLGGREWGFYASALWAVYPDQAAYVSLIGTEYLFLFLMLACACLFLALAGAGGRGLSRIAGWCALGVLISSANAVRPMGLILLAAFILHRAVFAPPRGKSGRGIWLLSCAAMLACFFLTNAVVNAAVRSAVGQPDAPGGSGWSLYVGMNTATKGQCGERDGGLFSQKIAGGLSAPEVQSFFLKEAEARFRNNLESGKLVPLILDKFSGVWASDRAGSHWIAVSADPASPPPGDFINRMGRLSDGFYFMTLFLCAAGLFIAARRGDGAPALMAVLFFGIAAMLLIAEANPRYHFPADALFCILAAGALSKAAGTASRRFAFFRAGRKGS